MYHIQIIIIIIHKVVRVYNAHNVTIQNSKIDYQLNRANTIKTNKKQQKKSKKYIKKEITAMVYHLFRWLLFFASLHGLEILQ